MVRIPFVPLFFCFLLNDHVPRRRRERSSNWYLARSRYGSNWVADTMSDRVVESMQEIVSELKKEQRRLFVYCVDNLETLSATYRRQVAARRPELAFTSRSVEES